MVDYRRGEIHFNLHMQVTGKDLKVSIPYFSQDCEMAHLQYLCKKIKADILAFCSFPKLNDNTAFQYVWFLSPCNTTFK